ncbi:X-Pro dipeptidyl-peptidase-like protein [Streptomyces sp. Ag82_O1-15]|nr:X-Pro dipeptidyl-peptidase-like protein [Streptomyces sp. Ag82_O1-15]
MLLARLPYGKQTLMMGVVLDPLAVARHGFMVVRQDTRGRFASEGEREPFTYEESDGTTPYGGPPPSPAQMAPSA